MSSKASFTSVDSLVTESSPNTMSQDVNSTRNPGEDRESDKQPKMFTPFSIRDILEDDNRYK